MNILLLQVGLEDLGQGVDGDASRGVADGRLLQEGPGGHQPSEASIDDHIFLTQPCHNISAIFCSRRLQPKHVVQESFISSSPSQKSNMNLDLVGEDNCY